MAHALAMPGPGGPLGSMWRAYESSLKRRPLITQAATSALLWGVGDALGQRVTNSVSGGMRRSKSMRRPSLDMRQSALTAAFGGAVVGPAGSFWYQWLDQAMCGVLGCTNSQILGKVAADALLYTPLYVSAFFAYGCAVVDGDDPTEIRERMVRELPATVACSTFLWPPAMALVFKRVPVQHQLLIVNFLTVFEVAILSLLRTPTAHRIMTQAESTIHTIKRKLVRAMPRLPGQPRRRTMRSKPLAGRLSLDASNIPTLQHMHPAPGGFSDSASLMTSSLFPASLFAPVASNDNSALCSEYGSDMEPNSPRCDPLSPRPPRWRSRFARYEDVRM